MKIAFNPSTVAALTTPPNNKDITFDLRGRNIFARGVKFCGTDTNTWRDIKINNVSIGSHTLDLRNGSNTTLTNTNGVVTINSTWRPVVDNLTSNSTTSSLSANQGRVLAGLINGKSDSDHNHDGRYVKKSGDTMLGALNFANGTWNLVGGDSYMGDCNVSGHVGIKAANTTYPGIAFFNNASTYLGNLTAYSGNIKYGAYSLQFLDNGNTSVRVSTWTNPFSAYNSNAIADGQAICVWGQASQLSNLSTDTGDMSLWLKRVNAKVATLNMVLDGEYYAGGNQRLAHVSEIPTSLKNPYALTISLNGTSQGPYDGSAAKNINITPGSIGAATSGHNHDDRYLKLTGGTMLLGEGLKFHSNDNYFGTNADARIISLLDNNDKICDGGLIIDERATLNGKEYVTELLRIRDSEFKWRGADILHSGNYSGILDSRYYTESEVNNLLSKKLDRVNLSTGNWNPRGYHLAADYNYNGGDLSISESGGQIYVSVDGCFWQNEGKYRVLDTSDVAGLKNNLTVHQYLSNTDTTWWPLIWGGSSHNNASDSTGAVYKSHDVLSWQTSSQTLYATNIQTENIKHLSIGGGIYWNPNVESTTDSSDAASITLVRQGVAGGTTLILSQMNGANDTIQFKTNTAARLYHNSYPILTTQNTYVSNNKGYINGTEITQVNNADTVDGEHASNFVRAGNFESANLNSLDTYSFIKSVNSTVASASPGGYTGWYNVIQAVHRNGSEDGPGYIGQIALGMTTNINRMFYRTKYKGSWYAWNEVVTTNTGLLRYSRNNVNISSSNCSPIPPSLLEWTVGYPRLYDPEFNEGDNNVQVYNNTGNRVVTVTRVHDTNVGNSSSYVMKVVSAAGATPNYGGWHVATQTELGKVYTCLFRARIPSGVEIEWNSNPIGTGGQMSWLTNNMGTDKWTWYAVQVYCGSGGSTTFFFSAKSPCTWYLSYVNVIENNRASYAGLRSVYSDYLKANASIVFGRNELQYFNQYTGVTAGATNNANPKTDWYHILRMNHANNRGYFVDLAIPFFDNRIQFRRITSGSDNGWRRVITEEPNHDVILSEASTGGNVGIGINNPAYKLDVNGQMRAEGFHHWTVNSDNYMLLAGGGYKSFGGDDSNPVFLGYLNLDHGNDGTISSSFYCLGYSVPFTYTRGGNYCRISIPDTTHQVFYIGAATASVHYSGGGMDTWVGVNRGSGAWWLHCYAQNFNEVRVKGFSQNNRNNDSWWGGNPLWSGNDGANRITVCIFGYVKFR